MKKKNGIFKIFIMMLIMVISAAMLAGCGGSGDQDSASSDNSSAEETQVSGDASADSTAADGGSGDWNDIQNAPEIDMSKLGGPGGVDVDLTKLSSTMVYAVVNDMITKPSPYLGKKVRMSGAMSEYHDEDTGNTYYACLIKDATACCAQGIEFITTDAFPVSEYPESGAELTVVGMYDTYEDDGYQYCVLRDAVFE